MATLPASPPPSPPCSEPPHLAAAGHRRLPQTPTPSPCSVSVSASASLIAGLTAVISSGHPASTSSFPSIFPRALRAAADLRLPDLGLQLHALLTKTGLLDHPLSASALLHLYATLAPLPCARLLFDRIPKSAATVPWNIMILRYAQDGFLDEAFELMMEMTECNVPVGASTWNAVIAGCISAGEGALAVSLLGEMVSAGGVMPNVATFNTLLHVVAVLEGADVLRELHGFVLRNTRIVGFGHVDLDRLWESLAAGYMRSCCVEYADRVFQDVRMSTCHLGNLMISGFLNSGQRKQAFDVFREMAFGCGHQSQHLPTISLSMVLPEVDLATKRGLEIHAYAYRHGFECDTSVCNALMAMYAKGGNIYLADIIFQGLADKDAVSWNTMISSYAAIHDYDVSFKLFREMQRNAVRPDEYTFTMVLNACSFACYLGQSMALHGQMMKMGLCDSYVDDMNSLMSAYGKCGLLEAAQKVFDETNPKDVISWNIIISCYGYSALPWQAIPLFHQMQDEGYKPTRVTFIAVLSACSHAGLLDEAFYYLEEMDRTYNISPGKAHYACIVDCLGRAGQLEKAYDLIKGMPVVPTACVWGALLSSCRIHGNIILAEICAKNLIELDPQHSGYWILLKNIYSKAMRWDDAEQLRAAMKDKGIRKCAGYSWIEIGNGEVHRFLTGDQLHEQRDHIYEVLGGLTRQMMDEGYEA
uniref:Pentatricopeptide repeat-containing protein n=2 Tax=Oryza brachyantha TaxID=4533 RepID=J3MS44_ORYBR